MRAMTARGTPPKWRVPAVMAIEGENMAIMAATSRPTAAIIVTSSPSAQSGRERNLPVRICSRACAWSETPGTFWPSGVARMSSRPAADVPTNTMLPSIKGASSSGGPLSTLLAET